MNVYNYIKRKLFLIKRRSISILMYQKFKGYTMVPQKNYIDYLSFLQDYKYLEGDVVECGVWRGGAIAGLANILGDRNYYLFDSFEGLPEAKEIDGETAIEWQNNVNGENYYDNCAAEINWAQEAMKKSGQIKNSNFIKGWFNETLPSNSVGEIAILRLDGDWYESTIVCLDYLFDKVKVGGVIILDDYYTWDGCSKALHDFLAKNKRPERIKQLYESGCYLIKR